jgi:VWFA-related protein
MLGILTVLLSSPALPQAGTPPSPPPEAAAPPTDKNAPEVSSREETTTFKVKVNLVEVRVVVRDAQGHVIGTLKQEDFQLLDNGKPQVITKFSVEQAGSKPVVPQESVANPPGEQPAQPPATATAVVPQRYIAYLFDDIHLSFSDLAQARTAAIHQLQSLQPTDRAAVFSTSGQTQLDFTDDRAQLTATMNRLLPRPIARTGITPCPNISYYMADLIENRNDPQAMQVVMQDATDCNSPADQFTIKAYARQVLTSAGQEIQFTLGTLKNVVRRISAMPGQRTIILISPGFMNTDGLREQSELLERALHSNVVINALDARGLYTDMPDASQQRAPSATIAGLVQEYHTAELAADADILADLADATGGTFFHNNNDLAEGFRRLAATPEFSYLLGFSPQNLKPDGHYHKLKVTLKSPARGAVQARKGYYAPKGATDPAEQARQSIEDAVFSQEESREIPVELHTQFFKPDENDAKLSVVVHMDVRHIHFRKVNGRNDNDVTIVSAIFDRNGNFVSGNQKVLQLHLKDETLESRLNSGINLKSSFDVKPGSYVVRLVVRDEDGQLSEQNSAVEIQ